MIALLGGAIACLILIGLPLGFAIIISCIFIILLGGSINPIIIPQRMFAGMDSFSLLAIPFFLLAGSLMTVGGISERLISLANALVGRFRGGLAISNILTSILFGGISGSAVADTSAIGGTFIPAMTKEGYDTPFSVAATAASSPLSPLIPPSIAWIIYGYITDTSIIRMFAAGILPGLVWGFSLIFVANLISRKRRYPVHEPASLQQVWYAFRRSFFALMMPAFILIGILSGVFTVTEASAIAVVYALCVGLFVYRQLNALNILLCLKRTSRTVAAIMIIVGGAKLFAWVLAYTHTPEATAAWMTKMTNDPIIFLLMVNLLLLAVGTFMEVNAAKVMLMPVLFPIAMELCIDPVHFGVVVTVNLCIGLVTPPIGIVLALGCKIGGISLEKGTIAIFPFFVVALFVLLILTFFPIFSIWLPNLLFGHPI
jgi:tripartite ATP-independent transporter DctM subunit